jgi:hypothetical protein
VPVLPDVAKVVRVACSGTDSLGGLWLTRFFVSYSGTAPVSADLATFDAAVNTAWGTNLKPLHGNDTVLTQIESVDLSTVTGAVDISAVTQQGTRAGTYIPGSAALVSSYKISRRYRGGHPRGYWPFGMTGDVANPTTWATAFQTACNTGLNAFFTAVLAAGWSGAGTLLHVNVSYYKGFTVVVNPTTGRARNVPTLRVTPVVDTITAQQARISIGTQRRRINYHE